MTRRRGNGEGTIGKHPKRDLYMARYTVQTPSGPKRKTIYGKKREDVAAKLAKALSDRADGIVVDDRNLSVGGQGVNVLPRQIPRNQPYQALHRATQAQAPERSPSSGSLARAAGLGTLRLYGTEDPPRLAQGARPGRAVAPHPP